MMIRAWRSWKNSRTAALLAVSALAAGIGSTTAIYTVVNQVLYRKAPYQHGDRFVAIFGTNSTEPKLRSSVNFPDLNKFKDRTRSFDVFGWFQFTRFNLSSPGSPQHLNGIQVTPPLVQGLGVRPLHGQWFTSAAENSAVISYSLWQRLGGDPLIVGKPVTLNGRGYTISGVMAEGFQLPTVDTSGVIYRCDVWVPLDPSGRGQDQRSALFGYARIRPGVSREQADADVKRVAAAIATEDPSTHPHFGARIDPLEGLFTDDMRSTLHLLFAATGLLLLISCANVAGLLLARSTTRARETAVRCALGAQPWQLAVQFYAEGLILSLAGGVLGILLSIAMLRSIGAVFPAAANVQLEWTAILFCVAMAFLSSGLSSLAPLWQALRTNPADALGDGLRSSAGVRTRMLSRLLVVGELALAFMLVCVGGLLIDRLDETRRVWPGFNPHGLLTFSMTLTDTRNFQNFRYHESLIDAIEAIPGVRSAGFVNQLPLDGCCFSTAMYPQGRSVDRIAGERLSLMLASPGYLRTVGIPLLSGRFIHPRDLKDDLLPVVLNHAAAMRYWPDGGALGAFGRLGSPQGSRFEVVGIVGDVRNDGLNGPPVPEIYLPAVVGGLDPFHFIVRSTLASSRLVPQIRAAIGKIDATQPIFDVRTMDEILQESLSLGRASSLLMVFFGVSALIMASLGIYGLVSYSVVQRTV